MSARHGVADTREFGQREGVAATKEFRQRESVAATKKNRKRVLPLRRKFVKEVECVLRQRIYRKKSSYQWLKTQDLNFRAPT